MENELSARPIQHNDIPSIIKYWCPADPDFLCGFGVETHGCASNNGKKNAWEKRMA